jgi:5-methylcytosine-specific restriction endonuclease McrA
MRRLNVRSAQINECIQKSMFALSSQPQTPRLQKGELLLLQLVRTEAEKRGKMRSRIDFALVFDHMVEDVDGSISRLHWPNEDRIWKWIVYCSATIPAIPFSLEDLPLSVPDHYGGQANPRYIAPQDEQLILPYMRWSLAEAPAPYLETIPTAQMVQKFGQTKTLSAIFNHDRIAILKPVPKKTVTVHEFVRNPWLAESLRVYYGYRCQICSKSFFPDYGVDLAETHHIHYLSLGGPDVSSNIVVTCPNHHRVIHATDAHFNDRTLTYEYPNGLREALVLPDHLLGDATSIYQV